MTLKNELLRTNVVCENKQDAEVVVMIYQSYGFTWPTGNKYSKPKDGFYEGHNTVSVNEHGTIRFGDGINNYNRNFKLITYQDFINRY